MSLSNHNCHPYNIPTSTFPPSPKIPYHHNHHNNNPANATSTTKNKLKYSNHTTIRFSTLKTQVTTTTKVFTLDFFLLSDHLLVSVPLNLHTWLVPFYCSALLFTFFLSILADFIGLKNLIIVLYLTIKSLLEYLHKSIL